LTDVFSGVTAIHWAGDKLVFSGFQDYGWDLFVMKNPVELVGEMVPTEPDSSQVVDRAEVDFGDPEVEKYGVRFTPDWVVGGLSYSTSYGLAGQSQISVSDILGNHRIYLVSDLLQSIEESNFLLAYWYLPRRLDFGFAIFQQKYYYLLLNGETDILSEREYGGACLVSYPFNKFQRVDLQLESYLRERSLYEYAFGAWRVYGRERKLSLVPYLSLVYDNTLFGMTGPSDGLRYNLTYGKSIGITSDALRFSTVMGDVRKYWRLTDRYSFATRLLLAHTTGRDAERFWIGGSESLRGYPDYSLSGYYIGFFNMELRYPFIDRFSMAFPLPLEIRSLRGALFLDLGAATDVLEDFSLVDTHHDEFRLRDLKVGFGAGIRFPISFFLIKLDVAKSTDLNSISRATHVHFSLGADF
jgi:outer membrane protein assembly factor BamA